MQQRLQKAIHLRALPLRLRAPLGTAVTVAPTVHVVGSLVAPAMHAGRSLPGRSLVVPAVPVVRHRGLVAPAVHVGRRLVGRSHVVPAVPVVRSFIRPSLVVPAVP
eukprot:7520986-Pyramimonas_sp.AAC.1